MVNPQAGPIAAPQASRIARPVTFSVTAPRPAHGMLPITGFSEPECPHTLKDVAYVQVRRRAVKFTRTFKELRSFGQRCRTISARRDVVDVAQRRSGEIGRAHV